MPGQRLQKGSHPLGSPQGTPGAGGGGAVLAGTCSLYQDGGHCISIYNAFLTLSEPTD